MNLSKDIHYMDLLREMSCDILRFTIEHDTGFINSLIEVGYSLYPLKTPEQVSKWFQAKDHPYGDCAPTSLFSTGHIWVEEKEQYYEIVLNKVEESRYEVVISRVLVEERGVFCDSSDLTPVDQIRYGDIIELDDPGATRYMCIEEVNKCGGVGVWVENVETKERKWLFDSFYRVVIKN